MQGIKLSLSVDEVNLVLEGLGSLPFAKVYALVGKVQAQASEQLAPDDGAPAGTQATAPAVGLPPSTG